MSALSGCGSRAGRDVRLGLVAPLHGDLQHRRVKAVRRPRSHQHREQAVTFEEALRTYLSVADVTTVETMGVEGVGYVDKKGAGTASAGLHA